MPLSLGLDEVRPVFVDSVSSVLEAVEGSGEYDLFGPTPCWGWTRVDVVAHLVAGWQELLGGMVSVVPSPATVDAASFWTAFEGRVGGNDPVAVLASQRRRTAAFTRPGAAVTQLRDVGEAVLRGARVITDQPRHWLGEVFGAGDFLAVWAVRQC